MVAFHTIDIVPEFTSRTLAGLTCCVEDSVSTASVTSEGRRIEISILWAWHALGTIKEWSFGWAERASKVDRIV